MLVPPHVTFFQGLVTREYSHNCIVQVRIQVILHAGNLVHKIYLIEIPSCHHHKLGDVAIEHAYHVSCDRSLGTVHSLERLHLQQRRNHRS